MMSPQTSLLGLRDAGKELQHLAFECGFRPEIQRHSCIRFGSKFLLVLLSGGMNKGA